MKTIYFSRGGKMASGGMRGGWISYALSKSFTKHILPNPNVKNSIVIILKHDALNEELLSKLKSNNNIIILDVIDWLDLKKYNKVDNKNQPNFFPNTPTQYYDGYIVNNSKMKTWWYNNIDNDISKPIFVIPHHWDPRFADLPTVNYKKSPYFYFLGYVGHEGQNCLHINTLKSKGILSEIRHGSNDIFFKNKPLNGVQFSIRNYESWEYCFKPATKVASAVAMDSLIITTNDWSVQDILDPEYPYLLKDSSYESLIEMITYLKETHDSEIGKSAMNMIKNAGIKTSLYGSIAPMYTSIIKNFS